MSKIMCFWFLCLTYLTRLTSGSNIKLAAMQMIETSINHADELKLLRALNVNPNNLSESCIADTFFHNNRNLSVKVNLSYFLLHRSISFPLIA